MTPTEKLIEIRAKLRSQPQDETTVICINLITTELKRRQNSGRPSADKTLQERNREASKKYREKMKLKALAEADKENRKNKRHDKAMQKAGLMPKSKKKPFRNKQSWKTVPKVKPDGLHY